MDNMSEFKVTREMVQELAETGAYQLPMSTLPDEAELAEFLCPLSWPNTSVTSIFTEFANLGIFPDLVDVAKDILKIAYPKIHQWSRVRQQTFRVLGVSPTKYNPHQDGGGDLSGISVIFTKGKHTDEQLLTMGRAAIYRDPQSFYYRNGPVVITQKDFGKPLLKPHDYLGATWHLAKRLADSRVGVLDFFLD